MRCDYLYDYSTHNPDLIVPRPEVLGVFTTGEVDWSLKLQPRANL